MLDDLIKKLISWNQLDADIFYNNSYDNFYQQFGYNNCDEGKYLWDITNNGTFLWRNVTAIFFHNNGTIYKLTKWWNDNDWNLHNRLYEEVFNDELCIIEIPIFKSIIEINGDKLMYTIVQRPDNMLGNNMFINFLNDKIDTEYFLNTVEKTSILLNHFNNLHKKYNCYFPSVIPKLGNNTNRDFWYDFKQWNMTLREHYDYQFLMLNKTLNRSHSMFNISVDNNKIYNKAKKEWKF